MPKGLCAVLAALALLCAVQVCECAKVTVTVLHTNDVHGHLQPYAPHAPRPSPRPSLQGAVL